MTQSEEIRLLGGSHHGKKMIIGNLCGPLVMRKKPKRMTYSSWQDSDSFFTIEEEIYERKNMHKYISYDGVRWKYEIKTAFVKKGSKIKDETLWKLGMHLETYYKWQI